MPVLKRVGPLTVEVESGKPAEGDRPAVSGVYRNVAAADGFTTTVDGATTLYEIFKNSVDAHGDSE